MKKRLLSVLLALCLLAGLSALADGGQADVTFMDKTYHYIYKGAEIVDGALVVKAHGDDGVPVVGLVPHTPALAIAEIGGERVMPHNVNVHINGSVADFEFTYDAADLPDAVWLYPDGKEEGAVLLWTAGDPVPEAEADDTAAEAEADEEGFFLMTSAGFNPGGPAAAMARMQADAIKPGLLHEPGCRGKIFHSLGNDFLGHADHMGAIFPDFIHRAVSRVVIGRLRLCPAIVTELDHGHCPMVMDCIHIFLM